MGITTVVDLRAEDLSAAQLAGPEKAGRPVRRSCTAVRESAAPAPRRRRIS
ncbi:hypothetical protein RNB18_10790 [Streptomyces sp. DSM 41640]|uniref:FXSXX-COOH protein n=1 Tax=Streptomyces doebereineriae TaxID=3075528 RepID=A0ABU2V6Q9_9ACTN|nr:hypothetical protein [Streptomyces sp. DSM 41640]MDT0480657.1 hypothetical protein [Streptomyces sp. DSM 41640]